ncbi:MAG: hypothetical protein ABL949_10030 [Fimbriimonadaceae bacterium]
MKRRGSALIFVIAMVFSITSMVVVTAAMNRSVNNMNESVHRSTQEELALDSSAAYVTAMSDSNAIALNNNYTMTVGGENYTVKAIDNSTTMKLTYAVSAVGSTRNKTTSLSAMSGTHRTAHPTYYALWCGSKLMSIGTELLAMNTDNAFVYANEVAVSGISTFTSDLTYNTSSNISSLTNAQVIHAQEEWFPVNSSNYDAATPTAIASNNLTNFALGTKSGAHYNTYRRAGNLDIGGVISGTGVIIVDGNLNISSNLSYSGASDRCVFLVTGVLTFSPTVTQAVGHFYVNGAVSINNVLPLVITRGTIACNGNLNYNQLDVTPDPYFLQNQDQCEPYRLPGFWPVTDPRLNRP